MWAVLAVLSGCTDDGTPIVGDTAAVPVLEGPVITHVPPEGVYREGDPIALEATAEDDDGVEGIDVYFRTAGELPYFVLPLDRGEDDVYRGVLEGPDVNAPGLQYHLRAFDRSDFRVPADFPADGPDAPITVPVSVVPLPVPYEQPFDGTTTSFGVYEVGWSEHALGFRGERWAVVRNVGTTGGAAVHGDGYAGIEAVDDWLVTPALDLSGLESAEVRFAQRGEHTERMGVHSLWLSTGSPNPDDGDFVQVTALPDPPEGAWATAPVVDLSAWAGQSSVVLAWRYEGGHTDVWQLDDVRVRVFGPDLQLVSVEAPRLDPGTVGALEVTLANLGAPTAGPVTLTGDADPTRAQFPGSVALGALGTGQTVTAALDFAVDPEHPDNTALPVVLAATDGSDGGTWPVELLVGDRTRGIVRVQTLDAGYIRVWVGTGNPLQPHAEEVAFLGNRPAGVHTFEADLSDHLQYLPSVPGRLRWWVRLETAAQASLVGFGIDYDGQTEWTDTVGPFPPGQEALFYLPGRAEPVLVGGMAVPDPIVPGEPATVELTLRNDGGWTVGETRVRYASADPDLTVLAIDDVLSGPSGWAPGAVTTVSVPVLVASGHTDSTPVALQLTVSDTVDAFPLPVDVPVPWADLRFGAVRVVDLGANGNGILDPGEGASLLVEVRNDGALATEPVTCTLQQTAGPSVTLDGAGAFLGPVAPGAATGASFAVVASAGAVGDELIFDLACADARASWSTDVSVVIGGVGWTPFPLDPVGDAGAGSPMDLRDGRWRVDGDVLSIEMTSATDLDLATLGFEIWGFSAQSGFSNHVVIAQAGMAQLYGVRSGGFDFLADVPLTLVDTDTVRVDLDLPSMQLSLNELAMGVGAGFCATGDLYCDHWPDGWGNPYASAPNTQIWFLLTW
ncbi:MAG: choice-of-anchor J domain-containing protein [Myxococcota bacterium]